MRLIELTDAVYGLPITIAASHITAIRPEYNDPNNYTVVRTAAYSYVVKENHATVKAAWLTALGL